MAIVAGKEVTTMGKLGRRLSVLLGAGGLALGVLTASAVPAVAAPRICSGTPTAPGVLAGTYSANVVIEGACEVNAGPAIVKGNLTVAPGGALIAAFALNDHTGHGSSNLTVAGNLQIQSGAAAVLGCEAAHFACIDDPAPNAPTLASRDSVSGNLTEQQPLGVVVHDSTVGGNVLESGGGGGLTCEPSGVFALFQSPVYSDYEDLSVGGNLSVTGLTSCWLGIARVHVSGNLRLLENQLADPDAIEILANRIGGNLICQQNSQVWDSADETEALYPRAPEPNTVSGLRAGQCVFSSPVTEGGPLGTSPF
jgi:hypothetical protein